MQIRFFTIPVHDNAEAAEELNRFLASHRVTAIDRSLVQEGANSAWALCVSFDPSGEGRPPAGKRGKVDYKEVLSEEDFTVFARLRSLRKELADREGAPAYALFTNEQLAAMVQRRVRTPSSRVGPRDPVVQGRQPPGMHKPLVPNTPGEKKPPVVPAGKPGPRRPWTANGSTSPNLAYPAHPARNNLSVVPGRTPEPSRPRMANVPTSQPLVSGAPSDETTRRLHPRKPT